MLEDSVTYPSTVNPTCRTHYELGRQIVNALLSRRIFLFLQSFPVEIGLPIIYLDNRKGQPPILCVMADVSKSVLCDLHYLLNHPADTDFVSD